MSVAFWSVKLTNGKAVEVQPPEGYVLNVQQAAITGEGSAVVKVHTTSVEGEKLEAVIGTLRSKSNDQFAMSLVFGYDVPVAFSCEGKGEVYLSGYYQPGPEEDEEGDENDYDDDSEDDDSEDEDDEDEESGDDDDEEQNIRNAEAAIAKLGASRGKDLVVSGKKVSKQQLASDSEDEEEEEDEDSGDDDSEDERIDTAFIAKMVARNGLTAKDAAGPKSSRVQELPSEDDDDEESGDEEEDSEEEEDEQPPMKVQKSQPKGVVTHKQQQNGNSKPNTPAPKHQHGGNSKPNTPAAKQQQGQNKTPAKTPNTGNKQHQQHGSGFKSGDKRKR